MTKFICVKNESYSIDTDDERESAADALLDAGWDVTSVFVGDPVDPSAYASGEVFRVDPEKRCGVIHSR